MERLYSILFHTMIAAILLCGSSSCMKEDRSDCPDGATRVLVKFDPDMYDLPAGEHEIENVNVYVFDETDRLIASFVGDRYDYTKEEDYIVKADLDPGTYQFVAWTNLGTTYKCEGHETPSTLQVYLENRENNLYYEDINDLHYGTLSQVKIVRHQYEDHIIHLLPNTYRINFKVNGLPLSTDQYEFVITDNNSHFNYDNSIVPGKNDFHYIRTSVFEQEQLTASMRILPLTDDHAMPAISRGEGSDRSINFTLSNAATSQVLYTDDLVRMIRLAYEKSGQQVDFDKTYKFDITITYDAQMNVTIGVNGWVYQYNPTEL